MSRRPVYLDNNATTALDPRVFAAMRPWFLDYYGNAASSTHLYGWEAADAVEEAREQVAALVKAHPKEVFFTSGATESINLALKGMAERLRHRGNHILTCATEHRAVLDTCRYLEQTGFSVSVLPVRQDGRIDPELLSASIRPTTILMAIMYANNETGVLQPIREIGAIARQKGVTFFCDATQAVGKMPVDMSADGIDLLAFSAHKIYGPKGVGALVLRRGGEMVSPLPLLHGGGHEGGLRSGTLNVPGIVGLGEACVLCFRHMTEEAVRMKALRDRLETALLELPASSLNGHPDLRLGHVTNIAFRQVEGQSIMQALARDVAVSSGSACSSVIQAPSHVLKAMGLEDATALASFRFSLGRFTTEDDITLAIEKVRALVSPAFS